MYPAITANSDTQPLLFRFWDEECVVYNRLSGDVHLLSARHAEMLESMSNGTPDVELVDHLMAEYSLERGESANFLNTLRSDFSRLGLIDPLWN